MDRSRHRVFRFLVSQHVHRPIASVIADTVSWKRVTEAYVYCTRRNPREFLPYFVKAIRREWSIPEMTEFEAADWWERLSGQTQNQRQPGEEG